MQTNSTCTQPLVEIDRNLIRERTAAGLTGLDCQLRVVGVEVRPGQEAGRNLWACRVFLAALPCRLRAHQLQTRLAAA